MLGSYKGTDGLEVIDFPELTVKKDSVEFERIPTCFIVRNTLSKAGHEYVSFLPEQECEYLTNSLEMRMKLGEDIKPHSAIITQNWNRNEAGKHIAKPNVSDMMRKPIRAAGFMWRSCVFRRYFDTKMTIDSVVEGLMLRDFVTFFVGHREISSTPTIFTRHCPRMYLRG